MKRIFVTVLMLGMTGGAYAVVFDDLSMKAAELKALPTALPIAVPKRSGENKLIYSRVGCEISQPTGAVATVINDGDLTLWFWQASYTLTSAANEATIKEFKPLKHIPILPGATGSIPLPGGEHATGCKIESLGLYEAGQSPISWTDPTSPITPAPQQPANYVTDKYETTCSVNLWPAGVCSIRNLGGPASISGEVYFEYYNIDGAKIAGTSTFASLTFYEGGSNEVSKYWVPPGAVSCRCQFSEYFKSTGIRQRI